MSSSHIVIVVVGVILWGGMIWFFWTNRVQGEGSLRCRIGMHKFPTLWENIAPFAGGGPRVVEETCVRCGHVARTENWRG